MFRFLLKIVYSACGGHFGLRLDAAHADMANGSYLVRLQWNCRPLGPFGVLFRRYGPFSVGVSITANSSGELRGTGGFDLDGLGGDITSVSGTLTGSSADPHVAMKLRMSGKGNLEGINAKVAFSANMHYQLNIADKELEDPYGSGTIVIERSFHQAGPSARAVHSSVKRYQTQRCHPI